MQNHLFRGHHENEFENDPYHNSEPGNPRSLRCAAPNNSAHPICDSNNRTDDSFRY
jgi:hypothetical protein